MENVPKLLTDTELIRIADQASEHHGADDSGYTMCYCADCEQYRGWLVMSWYASDHYTHMALKGIRIRLAEPN